MKELLDGKVLHTRHRQEVNRGTIILAKSPLRISFAGGGTDLPHYYEENGGAVLSATISRYSFVTLYPRLDAEVSIRSIDLGFAIRYRVDQEPIFDGVLDLAKAAIRRMGSDMGFELDVHTEALPGSGLGGSSAVTAAILGAVAEYTGVLLSEYELAELNYAIERTDLGIAGGKQDQYATHFGGFNQIEFHKDRVVVTPLRLRRDLLYDLESRLLLCYTGKVRPSAGLIDAQVRYFQEGREETVAAMRRLKEMTYEMTEALLKGKLDRFGELLDEGYVRKKAMNPHVSDPRIDELCAVAKRHGAIGAKLLGAGGGGYLAVYVPPRQRHEVRAELEKAGGEFTSFSFDRHGLQVWRSTCP